MALTISRGEAVTDYQNDGGSTIYALFDELFRVIYNSRAYNGDGVLPQGIITAGVASVDSANSAAAYRTDCEIDQNILCQTSFAA